jgi:hypothetical protein
MLNSQSFPILPIGTESTNYYLSLQPSISGRSTNQYVSSALSFVPGSGTFTAPTVNILSQTISINSNTGALVVKGGVGINGNLNLTGTAFIGNVSATNTVVFPTEFNNSISGPVFTIDWRNRQKQNLTLTANCVLSYTAPIGVGNFILKLIQDGTGGRFVTWPTGTRWPGAVAPTLTTTPNAVDIVSIYYDGTNYYSQFGLNFG